MLSYMKQKEKKYKVLIAYNSENPESLRCMARQKQLLLNKLTKNHALKKHEVFSERSTNYWCLRENNISLHWFDVATRDTYSFVKNHKGVFRIYACGTAADKEQYNPIKWILESIFNVIGDKDMARFCIAGKSLSSLLFKDFKVIADGHDMYEVYINSNKGFELDVRKISFKDIKHYDSEKYFTTEKKAKQRVIADCLQDIKHHTKILNDLNKRYAKLVGN